MLAVVFVAGLIAAGARTASASCGSDSDCAGVGKCSSGKCGSCGSDSDCKGGRCSSGRCSNALSAGLDWLAPAEDAEAAGCGAPGADVFRIATTVPDARSCRRTAPAGGEAMSFTPVSGPSSSRASARPIRHAMP